MTMDAIVGSLCGDLLRCREFGGGTCVRRQLLLVGRISFVREQRALHRLFETGNGDMSIRIVPAADPRPVAPVDRAVRIQKHDAPGLIVVKLKKIQVEPVGFDDA